MMQLATSANGINCDNEADMVRQRLRLPSRMQGGSLRSMEDVAPAAFIAGMLKTDRPDND